MKWKKWIGKALSYVLVAMAASVVTLLLWGRQDSKLAELERVIDRHFIGQADMEKAKDAAASAMVQALGDRWSYYISAEDFAAYQENKDNAYVGIGVTIAVREDGTGIDILEVTSGGAAHTAGVLPGDILVAVDGQSILEMDYEQAKNLIRGEEGTELTVTVLRDGAENVFTLTRQIIHTVVAAGEMLDGNIGLVQINNFNSNCAKETLAVVKSMQEQGAQKLIFDVRNNPGGYVSEMLEVLDYLLPEGVLFRQEDYRGNQYTESSDAACLDLPMAVLVNGNSYSAAEFFAAALSEYDWATVVGEQTTGKGYYQNTLQLSDGSAVNLSTGKYTTPNGVNLTEVGGLTPDVTVAVDDEMAALIYADAVDAAEDPQIQAAVAALTGK
ncbi:MAG: S41 family peptidase [Oscillospiraceae bacterium]|nr:S41 family peptidase [Oscillospiraceae bacterium]